MHKLYYIPADEKIERRTHAPKAEAYIAPANEEACWLKVEDGKAVVDDAKKQLILHQRAEDAKKVAEKVADTGDDIKGAALERLKKAKPSEAKSFTELQSLIADLIEVLLDG